MAFSPILFGPVSRCWTPGPPRVPDVRGVGEGRCRGRDLCGALTAKRHPRRRRAHGHGSGVPRCPGLARCRFVSWRLLWGGWDLPWRPVRHLADTRRPWRWKRRWSRRLRGAERSVVAIARVRKGGRGIRLPLTVGNEFPLERGSGVVDAIPTSPDFVPNEFATGVVIDRQGHILTNYHVLGDPEENDYYIWTQRRPLRVASIEQPQEVRAGDPWTDLAVLKVSAENLEPIPLGDASQLRKGMIVIALGNPYGIARDGEVSASWGIVSNLRRAGPAGIKALGWDPRWNRYISMER